MTIAPPRPDVIRALRDSIGLTQAQAASLVYCTERGWQDWEGEKRRMHPAIWHLFRIKIDLLKERPDLNPEKLARRVREKRRAAKG